MGPRAGAAAGIGCLGPGAPCAGARHTPCPTVPRRPAHVLEEQTSEWSAPGHSPRGPRQPQSKKRCRLPRGFSFSKRKKKQGGGERGEEREKWGYGGRAGGREGGSGSVGCVRFLRISASLLQTSHAAAVTSAQAGHVPALRVSGHLCLQALVSPLLGDGLTPRAW